MGMRSPLKSKRHAPKPKPPRTIKYLPRQSAAKKLIASAILAVVLLPLGTLSFAQELQNRLPQVTFTTPESQPDTPVANTTGHLDLVWELSGGNEAVADVSYELVSSPSAQFEESVTHYTGVDTRSFVSGLEGRTYYFRVRAIDADASPGPWSDPIEVEVDYVSQSKVKLLMLIGTLCLLATILIIVGGSLIARNDYQPQS